MLQFACSVGRNIQSLGPEKGKWKRAWREKCRCLLQAANFWWPLPCLTAGLPTVMSHAALVLRCHDPRPLHRPPGLQRRRVRQQLPAWQAAAVQDRCGAGHQGEQSVGGAGQARHWRGALVLLHPASPRAGWLALPSTAGGPCVPAWRHACARGRPSQVPHVQGGEQGAHGGQVPPIPVVPKVHCALARFLACPCRAGTRASWAATACPP